MIYDSKSRREVSTRIFSPTAESIIYILPNIMDPSKVVLLLRATVLPQGQTKHVFIDNNISYLIYIHIHTNLSDLSLYRPSLRAVLSYHLSSSIYVYRWIPYRARGDGPEREREREGKERKGKEKKIREENSFYHILLYLWYRTTGLIQHRMSKNLVLVYFELVVDNLMRYIIWWKSHRTDAEGYAFTVRHTYMTR